MYNMLFGVNANAETFLRMLNLKEEDCGRFRDCYLSEDGTKIIVYTRNGGGNREDYQGVFNELSKHKNYICDYDDDFDCTYASIEFSVPDEYKSTVSELLETTDTTTGAEKWDKLFKMFEGNDDLSK